LDHFPTIDGREHNPFSMTTSEREDLQLPKELNIKTKEEAAF